MISKTISAVGFVAGLACACAASATQVTITHSLTQAITPLNSVACNTGGVHTENSYYRTFDLGFFGITDPFDITAVEIGIERAIGAVGSGGTQPLTVNIYSNTNLNALGVPLSTQNYSIADQALSILSLPINASIPTGEFTIEILTPGGQLAGTSFFIGCNADGQTAPSYIRAPDCEVTLPISIESIGFPGTHIVMNVIGNVPIAATMLIKETDALAGDTVASLNNPFVDGNGKTGVVVALVDSRRAILYDGVVVFTSDQALPDTLTGGEGTMGVGNNGEFIYSPTYNGDDAVWGQAGLVFSETQLFSNGFPSTFHSRPQMVDDGTSHWVTGWNDAGGTSTTKRGLAQRAPNGTVSLLIQGGEATSAGVSIENSSSAVQFDFDFSGNGLHSIIEVELDTGDANTDNAYLIDLFTIVGQEGDPTGQGDDWDNTDAPTINNNGNYIFSGDTNGATTSDEFLAYNGVIQIREGASLAGVTLGGSCDGSSLNNLEEVVFVWTISGGGEGLFYASDASDIAGTAALLLRDGDSIDTTDDGVADWVVTAFNVSQAIGPGLELADDGVVWAEVDVDSADGLQIGLEAIIGIRFRPCAGDWDGSGGQPNSSDFLAYLNDWSDQDPAADLAPPGGDNVWDSSDFLAYLNLYSQGC